MPFIYLNTIIIKTLDTVLLKYLRGIAVSMLEVKMKWRRDIALIFKVFFTLELREAFEYELCRLV